MRGLTRIFGVSRNMVSAGLKKAQNLPPLEATLAPAQPLDVLEARCTMELRAPSRRRGVIRLRLGLCRRTRQIVADALGPRDDATARLLWDRIPLAYRWSPLYTDPLESDHKSLPTPTHADYPKRGPTNHMERFNNTLRQRLGRFVRNAWFFSKSLQMHEIAIRCFLHQYNLTGRRIKPTLAIKAFGFSVLVAYPPPC